MALVASPVPKKEKPVQQEKAAAADARIFIRHALVLQDKLRMQIPMVRTCESMVLMCDAACRILANEDMGLRGFSADFLAPMLAACTLPTSNSISLAVERASVVFVAFGGSYAQLHSVRNHPAV